jgi:hypothetical protein
MTGEQMLALVSTVLAGGVGIWSAMVGDYPAATGSFVVALCAGVVLPLARIWWDRQRVVDQLQDAKLTIDRMDRRMTELTTQLADRLDTNYRDLNERRDAAIVEMHQRLEELGHDLGEKILQARKYDG